MIILYKGQPRKVGEYTLITSRSFRASIRFLSQLKEICRYIAVVEKCEDKSEKKREKMGEFDINRLDTFFVQSLEANRQFSQKYRCSSSKANRVYQDGIRFGYLEPYGGGRPLDRKYVRVTSEGRKLNSKSLKFIPTSRWNTWLEQHSKLVAILLGSGLTVAVGAIAQIAKNLAENYI